jgi:two-component system NtrC family sensor kinase
MPLFKNKSLRQTLALYFIPISILPTLFISYYSVHLFEKNIQEGVLRRAQSEKEAVISELEILESSLYSSAKQHASSENLINALRKKNKKALEDLFYNYPLNRNIRFYLINGSFFAGRIDSDLQNQLIYISKEGLQKVKTKNESFERYFSEDGKALSIIVRFLVKDRSTLYGLLEEEVRIDQKTLADIKNRKQIDLAFLSRDLSKVVASFAVDNAVIKKFTASSFKSENILNKTPSYTELGATKYAGFLSMINSPQNKNKNWGYLAIFLPLSQLEGMTDNLKRALLYVSIIVILVSILIIFIFSNRIIKPIELLVFAMKQVRLGRSEQVPVVGSTDEIDYLVQSFNQMSRNVSGAKRALEVKLDELKSANEEIISTQTTLVQSAKMISLGQLVAGVAHELNNPVGFIYSNLFHLNDYLIKIEELIAKYQQTKSVVPAETKKEIELLEKKLEIEFILKDMESLIKSCVDGAKRTKDIVLGLRNFSRMDAATFKADDIHEGIRSTIKILNPILKDKITVHEEFGDLPLVECSLTNLNQVFMNILSNAAQAIKGLGDIWITTKCEGDKVFITIRDNGEGISKENQEKIFDPFFTTKKVGEGTGLGLSIVYGIIQKHLGSISFESEVGKGTTFYIELPVKR